MRIDLNNKEFDWMSKSNRKINSKDVQSILGKTELLDFLFLSKKIMMDLISIIWEK
jgi:hypothetical protein